MCSIGEDDFGDEGGLHVMVKNHETTPEELNGICKKCNDSEIAEIKLDFREAECKKCFLAYVRHKFRATLGSSKILPKDADVLLIFDGSPSSVVLLDMMNFAQSQNTFKRLHCKATVLYIDESCLQERSSKKDLDNIKEFISKYNFPAYVVSICGKSTPIKFEHLDKYLENSIMEIEENKFKTLLFKITSLTSRQDYLARFRKKIIADNAIKLGKKYVFTSEINSDLATTLLTNISLGRGGAAALDVSLCDDRMPNVKIIRPLKSLNSDEIENYLKVNEIQTLFKSVEYNLGYTAGANTSIQNLTANFIMNLQKDFSSTVSTVFRTGDKIAVNSRIEEVTDNLKLSQCSFCMAPLNYIDSKTLLAVEFSRLASGISVAENLLDTKLIENQAKNSLNSNHVTAELCHGCRNIYDDCLDPKLFT